MISPTVEKTSKAFPVPVFFTELLAAETNEKLIPLLFLPGTAKLGIWLIMTLYWMPFVDVNCAFLWRSIQFQLFFMVSSVPKVWLRGGL
ncbi:hypothetical protein AO735_08540 [Pseudomonas sp. TTU2014-096BSC]|nr:hypothetical protein AO735_08540 [Pseudomonas sp. TTU2014-096BSC]